MLCRRSPSAVLGLPGGLRGGISRRFLCFFMGIISAVWSFSALVCYVTSGCLHHSSVDLVLIALSVNDGRIVVAMLLVQRDSLILIFGKPAAAEIGWGNKRELCGRTESHGAAELVGQVVNSAHS